MGGFVVFDMEEGGAWASFALQKYISSSSVFALAKNPARLGKNQSNNMFFSLATHTFSDVILERNTTVVYTYSKGFFF